MLILGLDQSITRTGFALYEYPGNERDMRCGSFSCKDGADPEEKCELFARQFKRLVGPKERRPDFIVWERARRRISAYPKKPNPNLLGLGGDDPALWTVNADQLLLPEIQGIIRGEAISYRIPHESVPPATWRAAIYGKGGGKLSRADAKAQARAYCRALRIAAGNEDEAEAACIARWAATCSQKIRLLFAEAAA
ncbi:hypothetical protein GHK50_19185 [Sinorhizobium medicae]|uniref:Uncharacterized protein n=1 Tax=Sinorhizobium medicae TaxID=110321 RepID=A0A6G1WJD2_9HYPH|nr:hypothetical protein [Sinorhizobium medicae]MDX0569806.1 hypothetical protein [Sinorhizobium medicae]MDX0632408.1 hypothetical protein [Sinorhizobium medicae]MDX0668334.1 hypothetical protein [Sinorhizobium medicae]MDX0705747.1 hypothetical protein [Sinorhizobium medicae]MQW69792.1 hypothetical protein [Sinorhizobium medicae]